MQEQQRYFRSALTQRPVIIYILRSNFKSFLSQSTTYHMSQSNSPLGIEPQEVILSIRQACKGQKPFSPPAKQVEILQGLCRCDPLGGTNQRADITIGKSTAYGIERAYNHILERRVHSNMQKTIFRYPLLTRMYRQPLAEIQSWHQMN